MHFLSASAAILGPMLSTVTFARRRSFSRSASSSAIRSYGLITAGTPWRMLRRCQPEESSAACAGVSASDIIASGHKPVQASLGVKFVLAQVAPAALAGSTPDITAFRKLESQNPELQGRLSLFLYARDGNTIRARMFAPLAGTWEDPATGSASATLGALLLSLDGGNEAAYSITQGVEMGRPSRLNVIARRAADGFRSRVGGGCVPMFRGEALL